VETKIQLVINSLSDEKLSIPKYIIYIMPRPTNLRGVRNQNIKISKHKHLAKPSMSGGALKKLARANDDYHTNLGLLRHSLKSLNISGRGGMKPTKKYIDF
jgi:hypothetical protein